MSGADRLCFIGRSTHPGSTLRLYQEVSLVFSLIIVSWMSQWHNFIIENIYKGCWASFI